MLALLSEMALSKTRRARGRGRDSPFNKGRIAASLFPCVHFLFCVSYTCLTPSTQASALAFQILIPSPMNPPVRMGQMLVQQREKKGEELYVRGLRAMQIKVARVRLKIAQVFEQFPVGYLVGTVVGAQDHNRHPPRSPEFLKFRFCFDGQAVVLSPAVGLVLLLPRLVLAAQINFAVYQLRHIARGEGDSLPQIPGASNIPANAFDPFLAEDSS